MAASPCVASILRGAASRLLRMRSESSYRSSGSRLASMPYSRNEYVVICGQGGGSHDVSGRTKPDHNLANVGVLDRRPDRRQCASRGVGIPLIEKGSQSLDVLDGVG